MAGNRKLEIRESEAGAVVIGTGAAGYHAAERLSEFGVKDVVVLAENKNAGTSRNTGSDKQTYYKLSLAGGDMDSVQSLAEDLFAGQCVDGDIALCEAALSARGFYHLAELGVPFPCNEYGEYIGYKTDHDRGRRATSAGPYTSKLMTEALEKKVLSDANIHLLDQTQAIRILVHDGAAEGVLCLVKGSAPSYRIIWCQNVVLATGGPGGMYRDSVYPQSQLGSSGMAFLAGVKGKNLTEWQYGMASVRPRWNVSGTYMQVLPRFVSTKEDGSDEKEFLREFFKDDSSLLSKVFLKGYQWPFDVNKIFGGSSIIDLLVYRETILRGRRVFLDYRENPCAGQIAFDQLEEEAYTYLKNAGACFGTPFDRLMHMNQPAVAFYREHGVDLSKEMLEIRICAQHNNGGLAADANWETDVHGLFAVGEVCGTHGVTRPGGTALNAGQVGSLRAADVIARRVKAQKESEKNAADALGKESVAERTKTAPEIAAREACRRTAEAVLDAVSKTCGTKSAGEMWQQAAKRMSSVGGMIRSKKDIAEGLSAVAEELKQFQMILRKPEKAELALYFHLYDMLTAQKVYLTAMLDYAEQGGKSRGSALYTAEDGEKPEESLPELYRCHLDKGKLAGKIQETWLSQDGSCTSGWRRVRPIPTPDNFFENQWKAYRERYGL